MSTDIRTKVKEAAIEKFVKYGYRRVTTDEIAKEVGISKRTLYEHFENKEEIIKSLIIDEMNNIKNQVEGICDDPEKNIIQKLVALFTVPRKVSDRKNIDLFKDIKNDVPEIIDIMKKYELILQRRMGVLFKEGQDAGYIRKDINPAIILNFGKIIHEKVDVSDFPKMEGITMHDIHCNCHKVFIQGVLSRKALVEHFDEVETLLEDK
jgi:TetR/AcrR family transcriptional regulator, cholesterol catabolism regulator